MVKRFKQSTVLLLLVLLGAFFPQAATAASAEFDQQVLQSGTLIVKAWFNTRSVSETGVVVKADAYNGYVLTGASFLDDNDRLTVQSRSGAELVAQVIQRDEALGLALVKVNGLDMTALEFSPSPLVVGRVVWSATHHQERLTVIPGHVSSIQDGAFTSNLPADLVTGAQVFVNECGEGLGFQSATRGLAVNTIQIRTFLESLNIRATLSRERCVSVVQQARVTAEQANDAAIKAQQEAEAAQRVASTLAQQLKVSDERNQQLIGDAEDAKQIAQNAIAAAKAAQSHAEQTRIELEKQTASLTAETEAMVQHLKQDRIAAEQRFREALEEQQESSTKREDFLLAALIGLFVLVILFLFFMQKRGFGPTAILTRVQEKSEPVQRSARPSVVKQDERPNKVTADEVEEYVFEGRDEDGIRYLLRVSSSQLKSDEGIVIGREAKHIINHVDVSRKHAKMSIKKNGLYIEDLGSTNGTSINGETIDDKGPVSVANGDQIIFGSVVMKLKVMGV